jgi:predicted CoA-binding protein
MPKNTESSTTTFLAGKTFAVAGASRDRSKYGNKVFQALVASGRTVYPLNPSAPEVEGQTAYASIADLPVVPESLSIVTPPQVTREVIQQAIVAGVKNIWMQPGAEDAQASQAAREAGINVIDDGSCVLVLLAIKARTKRH